MKFISSMFTKTVEIGTLRKGDTFVDPQNFDREEVLMVVSKGGYDCDVEFHDDESTIAAVNLTSGELWAYRTNEEVIQVVTEDITFKPSYW